MSAERRLIVPAVCLICNGRGYGKLDGREEEWLRCGECNGTGYADRITRTWDDLTSPTTPESEQP